MIDYWRVRFDFGMTAEGCATPEEMAREYPGAAACYRTLQAMMAARAMRDHRQFEHLTYCDRPAK
jgi:hypothetical protein